MWEMEQYGGVYGSIQGCMGAVWGSVWELLRRATWEDQARSQHAGIVHLTRHPQNDKIWQPVMAGTFPIIDQNVTFPLSGPS